MLLLLMGRWPRARSQTPYFFLPPSSLSARTVKEDCLAYVAQTSAGRSAFDTDSRDCVRFVTSKPGVLIESVPSFIISASTLVLQDSTSLWASASAALASDHFLSTSSIFASVESTAFPPPAALFSESFFV